MTLFLFLNDSVLKALSGQSKALGQWGEGRTQRNGESNRSRGLPGGLTLPTSRPGTHAPRKACAHPWGQGPWRVTVASASTEAWGLGLPEKFLQPPLHRLAGSHPQGPSGSSSGAC